MFDGVLVLNSDFDAKRAIATVASGSADAITFGRAFLTNPDLPDRLRHGVSLNADQAETWYTQGVEGYLDYPSRAVKIIVPFPPGGGNDLTARLLAERLQTELHQPFIVENRPGADGIVAFEAVKRSFPDGYVLLLGQSTGMTVNPAVYKRLPYEPLKDFEPISTVGLFPLAVVVNSESDIKTMTDLITKAKADSAPINLG